MQTAQTVKTRAAQRNGITAPKRAGFISYAWDLFDSATDYILAAHVPVIAAKTGLNQENLAIELRRWKRFNGEQCLRATANTEEEALAKLAAMCCLVEA